MTKQDDLNHLTS